VIREYIFSMDSRVSVKLDLDNENLPSTDMALENEAYKSAFIKYKDYLDKGLARLLLEEVKDYAG